jgi:tetratricopeptide (TPR) repeat protein
MTPTVEGLVTMKIRYVTPLAICAFALGVALGHGWQGGAEVAATPTAGGSVASILPANHPAVAGGSLEQAVMTTLRLDATGRTNTAAPQGAVSASGAPALLAQAESLRRARKFDAAADAYRKAIAGGAMTADTWADYADALASATSTLRGEPAAALERALALDPRHPKALWLKASLEHEEHHYTEAARTWQALLAVVPKDSSDARIIRANLAEATRLSTARS